MVGGHTRGAYPRLDVDLSNWHFFSHHHLRLSLFSGWSPPLTSLPLFITTILVTAGLGGGNPRAADFHPPSSIEPDFEDANGTVVVGKPGGSVTLDCNIFMLQDHTVSFIHSKTLKTKLVTYELPLISFLVNLKLASMEHSLRIRVNTFMTIKRILNFKQSYKFIHSFDRSIPFFAGSNSVQLLDPIFPPLRINKSAFSSSSSSFSP